MSKRGFIMITDSQLGTSREGRVATLDPALVDRGWLRGLDIYETRLAARVDPALGSGSLSLSGTVVPLTHYRGLRQFLRKSPRIVREVLRLVGGADVVITRLPGLIGLIAVAGAVLHRRPLAVEVVGDPVDALGAETRTAALLTKLGAVSTRWGVRRAAAVRFVTQETLQRAYPPAPGAQVVAFSSVQSTLWFTQIRGPLAERPTVVALGSHEQMYKGHDLLIAALPRVREHVPECRLRLLGQGRYQADLRSLASRLGVAQHVDFVGQVEDKRDVIRHVDAGWVFALPSRAEGLPRALVEAMARGKACVGTRVGGIPELLDDAQLIGVDDLDALVRMLVKVLRDDEHRARLGQRNESAVSAYRPENLAASAARWTEAVRALASCTRA